MKLFSVYTEFQWLLYPHCFACLQMLAGKLLAAKLLAVKLVVLRLALFASILVLTFTGSWCCLPTQLLGPIDRGYSKLFSVIIKASMEGLSFVKLARRVQAISCSRQHLFWGPVKANA